VLSQRYISKELLHFVGRKKSTEEQYRILVEVLRSGWLIDPRVGPSLRSTLQVNFTGKFSDNERYLPNVVCFCDIPIGDLAIHIEKYSAFGLSFLKPFLVERGANPVFYVARNAAVRHSLEPSLEDYRRRFEVEPGGIFVEGVARDLYFDRMLQEYHDLFLWKLPKALGVRQKEPGVLPPVPALDPVQRFLDWYVFSFIKFFDDSKQDDDPDNYYMEREWRMLGGLHFSLDDVYRVALPRDYASKLRKDVPAYAAQVTYSDE
jgi:hypothetical protein